MWGGWGGGTTTPGAEGKVHGSGQDFHDLYLEGIAAAITWENRSIMVESPPRLHCHLFPDPDGVRVVPTALPFHVPAAAYGMTVAEWLGLNADTLVRPENAR